VAAGGGLCCASHHSLLKLETTMDVNENMHPAPAHCKQPGHVSTEPITIAAKQLKQNIMLKSNAPIFWQCPTIAITEIVTLGHLKRSYLYYFLS